MFLINIQLISFIPGILPDRFKHENLITKSKIVIKQNSGI